MKTYKWSSEIEKAKLYLKDERISDAEAAFLRAENMCSDDSEEKFHLSINLALFYECFLDNLVRTEYYKEIALKNLKIFQGHGKSEIYGHLTRLADVKRRLGKVEEAIDIER